MAGHSFAFPSNFRHFLLNLITDMVKEIFVAVATSLILSVFAKKRKKNHSSSQDGNGSSSDD